MRHLITVQEFDIITIDGARYGQRVYTAPGVLNLTAFRQMITFCKNDPHEQMAVLKERFNGRNDQLEFDIAFLWALTSIPGVASVVAMSDSIFVRYNPAPGVSLDDHVKKSMCIQLGWQQDESEVVPFAQTLPM